MDRSWNQPLPRGRHHLTREEVRASQRRRILMAMIDEIAERGFAATSVAHVTARAGVSRKSFYEQFSDKRDCYFAAFDMATETQGKAVMRAARRIDPAASPIEVFRAMLRAFLETVAANPAAARTLLVESYGVRPDPARRLSRRHDNAMAIFLAPLGLSDGRGNLTFEGRAITAAIAAMLLRMVADGRAEEAPSLCDPFVDWVERHLDCVPPDHRCADGDGGDDGP
jgi:AcrR family transcriptional regulator